MASSTSGRSSSLASGLDRRPRQNDAVHCTALQKHGCVGHCEEGLARAGGTDAKHQLRALKRPHIGVLIGRARMHRTLARGNLRSGELSLAFHGRESELLIGGDGQPHRTVYIRWRELRALLQKVESLPGLETLREDR